MDIVLTKLTSGDPGATPLFPQVHSSPTNTSANDMLHGDPLKSYLLYDPQGEGAVFTKNQ